MRPIARSLIAAATVWATVFGAPAQAGCVWGQPGYRACVDALIAEKKEQDARAPGSTDTVRRFPTAPAKDRAPQLTPLDQTVGVPAQIPRVPRATGPGSPDVQRMLDENLARMQRDAAQPPIMPRSRELFPIPGRICPSQGC